MASPAPSLPLELWVCILEQLDSDSYIQSHRDADPASLVDTRGYLKHYRPGDFGLKTASLVCRFWRRTVLPMLFRNIHWVIHEWILTDAVDIFCHLLTNRHIAAALQNLTIIVPKASLIEEFHVDVANTIWHVLSERCSPHRVTLIGTPAQLGLMLGQDVDRTFEWAFGRNYTILQLEQHTSTQNVQRELTSQLHEESQTTLLSIRPWTSLFVNEGSFFSVYSRYEYFHFITPSIIATLLGQLPLLGVPTGSLELFSYVSIFPLSEHVRSGIVFQFPGAHGLSIRLQPLPEFYGLLDPEAHSAVDLQDPWVEFHDCLRHVEWAIGQARPGSIWDQVGVLDTHLGGMEGAGNGLSSLDEESRGISWSHEGGGLFVKKIANLESQ